jgi:hypothetical protein
VRAYQIQYSSFFTIEIETSFMSVSPGLLS